MIDFVQVGLKIMKYRKEKNLTQDDLADKLFITRQALSKWELGLSIPSIDSLIELSKILDVSIDDLLFVKEDIDEENIFNGHSRLYILKRITNGELKVDLPNIFYQFSPQERIMILKAIKDNKVKVDKNELTLKLTDSEKRYLIGDNYEILCKSSRK